jgi:hypothetical protein
MRVERFRKVLKRWRFLGAAYFKIDTYELGIDNEHIKKLIMFHEMWLIKSEHPKSKAEIRPHPRPFASVTKKSQPYQYPNATSPLLFRLVSP